MARFQATLRAFFHEESAGWGRSVPPPWAYRRFEREKKSAIEPKPEPEPDPDEAPLRA